jgi:ABC-2 type transport system permease protein
MTALVRAEQAMTALVRAELLKLCLTRATWAFVAAAVAIAVLRVGLILAGVGTIGSAGSGSADLTLAVLGASGSGVLVIALLGVLIVTREFHSATWTSTLLVTPDRARVMVAKFVAAGLTGIVVGVLLLATGACLGVASGEVRLTMSTALLQMVAGGLAYAACWGWFGAAIGALIRNQTVALVVPPVWMLVETLLPSYGLHPLVPFTLNGVSSALAGGDLAGALPAWGAALVLLGYGLALSVAAVRRTEHSDVS